MSALVRELQIAEEEKSVFYEMKKVSNDKYEVEKPYLAKNANESSTYDI